MVIREVEGEYIAVHTGRAKVFRINKTAGEILSKIKEAKKISVGELEKWLIERYPHSSNSEIKNSLISFLHESHENGLIESKE